ncbi:MFS transporter [Endozoicomonas atrinae]|uniref:MFS transporter n=2 Tax=Endozoicomonas atrinae TaxID=1333660 RepID=UPI0008271795|nr:MFS transporter [Endozoicomonas atrinae]
MLNKSEVRLVGITALGGLLEYYDFIIFALMAGYLANNFFPSTDPHTSLLTTFATFSVGYLSRPLGGLLFGHLGDRYGRKCTFAVTVLIMALSTTLIGCLPSHAEIGIWAPILLIFLRLLQGFSIGGEIPGAITLLSESNQKHLGLIISLLLFGILSGLLLGHLVHSLLAYWLDEQSMQNWGWRLPFWLGGSLGIFSYFIRKHIHESKLFLEMDNKKLRQQIPVVTLIKSHKRTLLAGIFLITPAIVTMTLLFLFSQSYLTQLIHYDAKTVTTAGCIGIIASICLAILFGWIADQYHKQENRVWLLRAVCLLIILSAIPIFKAYADYQLSAYTVALFSSLLFGPVMTMTVLLLSTAFPVSVRYSGVALSFNIALASFGGLAPVIAMTLIKTTDSLISPSYYLAFSGFCGLTACYLLKSQSCRQSAKSEQTSKESFHLD